MSDDAPPSIFVSYAHVSDRHKTWVRGLSNRLRGNGVNIQLDQWENTLGSNLVLFMESGLRESDRVIAVISDEYRDKTNSREGGSGFEGQILSSEMLTNQTATRVIPIIRDSSAISIPDAMPSFLKGYMALDMRDDALFEGNYETLLREIHSRPAHIAPPIGRNPFEITPAYMNLPPSQQPAAYVSVPLTGFIEFVHADNDGRYTIGDGERQFTTHWSSAGDHSVYALSDSVDIEALAVVPDITDPRTINDAAVEPRNSGWRDAREGDCVLWLNKAGYWAATVVVRVKSGTRPTIYFNYWIVPTRTADLSTLPAD